MWKFSLLVIVMVTFVHTEHLQINRTGELISTYAKVAHWGANGASNSPSEGRSSGQTLWTHRSDVNVRRGQNLKRKQPVAYYYSMRVPSTKVDDLKEENVPFKGEVQERFNPRPYFDFVFDDPPRQYRRPNVPKSEVKQEYSQGKPKPPAVVYGSPVGSVPDLDSLPKPPSDSYSSPFNSYNPPDIKPNEFKTNALAAFDYPPNNSPAPSPPIPSYGPPDDDGRQPSPPSVSYETPVKGSGSPAGPPIDSYVPNNYGPPQQPPTVVYGPPNDNSNPPKNSDKPNSDGKPPSEKFPETAFHPPLVESPPQDDFKLSKKPESSYFSPSGDSESSYFDPHSSSTSGSGNHQEMMPDTEGGMHNGDQSQSQPSSDYGPPISATVEPPDSAQPPYLDHPPTDHDYHQHHQPPASSMAEDDLSPPPAGVPYGKIPQYLDHEPHDHDFYHFGHHDVYHEVHTPSTTTTEAPRAGHYSYYYLGRKLWYIPLYFSVYFIVYVTVLILKSIARHKIQFSHNFEKSRASRQLDINILNNTVVNALEKQEKMYM